MPIYEFLCPEGHVTESIWALAKDAPKRYPCRTCGVQAKRIISMPSFQFSEYDPKTGHKIFKGDPWEGSPLEGHDGVDEPRYKSTKTFIGI